MVVNRLTGWLPFFFCFYEGFLYQNIERNDIKNMMVTKTK